MRIRNFADTTVLIVAAMASSSAVRADDAADAKAIVARGVKAAGIPADKKPIAITWKDKGTFNFGGAKIPYTADWAYQDPDKYRFLMNADFMGMKVEFLMVVNGNNAWEMSMGKVNDVTGEKLEHTLTEVYQFRVYSLTPLLADPEFKLAAAGEKDVNGKKTQVVKVMRDKRPAITLHFDKESGLLAKAEVRVKDEFQNWKEVLDEGYFEDYKDVNGRKFYTKLKIVRDGKPLVEAMLFDQKTPDKLDPKLFEKP